MTIEELDFRRESSTPREWPVRLLREEGTNLMHASELELRRGTPVYVEADADVVEVQRLMAHNHIRLVPVLHGDKVLGILDLVELALHEDLSNRKAADLAS